MLTCSKTYADIPFAHRQHRHAGHCSFVHGHNWSIKITFACNELDSNGFVVDFGNLKYLKEWISENLDHACLFASDDPLAAPLANIAPEAFKIYRVPTSSCEGISVHLWEVFSRLLIEHEAGRVWLSRIVLWEDAKNEATFEPSGDEIRAMRESHASITVPSLSTPVLQKVGQ